MNDEILHPGLPALGPDTQRARHSSLIEEHRSYARAIAMEMLRNTPSGTDRDELLSAAEFGLVQAAEGFDASRGITFATFAYYRIRGAIYDYFRRVGRQNKYELAANDYLADRTSAGIQGGGDSDFSEVRQVTRGVIACYALSREREIADAVPDSSNPEECVLSREQRSLLKDAMATLPERNRQVIQEYYFGELTFDQIADQMGLSKSWVSRIHARSIDLIRESLQTGHATSARSLR
jgi:RNA polymerase sigma factor FliA